MARYIPWFGKKRENLAERERELTALLENETDRAKLAKKADEVRADQVSALKSKRGQLAPSEKNAIAVAHLNREIKFWLDLTVEEIIEGYRTGALKGHRSTAVRRSTR